MINLKRLVMLTIASTLAMPLYATKMATFNSSSNTNKAQDDKDSSLLVISNKHLNRIVTPFRSPSIKVDNTEAISYKKRGNVLYLSTKHDTNVAAFITEGGDESSAIKVLFSPKPLPPQEIVLESKGSHGSEIARRLEQASPRTDALVNIMSSIATGTFPSGYQQKEVNASYLPDCYQENLRFEFYNGQFFSGGDYVMTIGVARNKTDQVIEFKENSCYNEGVVAVSGYPDYRVQPNSSVEVLVMYHRQKVPIRRDNKRKSLLGGGQ